MKRLVEVSLAIHNLNKSAEQRLGLSLVQFHILSALLELPGCSPLELAQMSGVHPSTLTQTLKILERKGLILIDKHPKDSRRKILLATRQGRDSHASFKEKIHHVIGDLSPVHLKHVRDMGIAPDLAK